MEAVLAFVEALHVPTLAFCIPCSRTLKMISFGEPGLLLGDFFTLFVGDRDLWVLGRGEASAASAATLCGGRAERASNELCVVIATSRMFRSAPVTRSGVEIDGLRFRLLVALMAPAIFLLVLYVRYSTHSRKKVL